VAENIDVIFRNDKEHHFIFAGFNALSKAEISIMKQLEKLGRGHILINADKYYLENDSHEAGRFMRQLMKDLVVSKLPYVEDEISAGSKHLRVIECAQHTGQVKAAATILDHMTKEEIDETMVLLADESLIAPLLRNLPKKIGQANITLGLPLKNSSLRTWVELIFRIQEGILKYNRVVAYHKDLINCWNHPFLIAIMTEKETQEVYQREKKMRKFNTVFQTPTKLDLSPKLQEIINLLYTDWKGDWALALQSIILS
jgi:hypothetical protein